MDFLPLQSASLAPLTARRSLRGAESEPTEEKKKELEKLKSACKDFESIFMLQMMKEMKKTVHKTRLIDGGFAEEVFSDMLDQERSKGIAIGLGDMLYQQLSRAITQPARKR